MTENTRYVKNENLIRKSRDVNNFFRELHEKLLSHDEVLVLLCIFEKITKK